MDGGPWKAVILDLDGVITRTARLHALAWKRTFDAFLTRLRGQVGAEDRSEFDLEADYRFYVDGRPRYDGVRSFVASRGITLPEGDPSDAAGAETVYGLGNRKNEIFLDLLRAEGVETYADAVEQIGRWRRQGLRTAVATSSRNGGAIIEAAGLNHLFDVVMDGVGAERLGLGGKPAPDIFLRAAERLGVDPREAMVVEDAAAGVAAARAGGFGRVVGVARDGGEDLREHGADVVVRDLRELDRVAGSGSGRRAGDVPVEEGGGGREAGEAPAASPPASHETGVILDRLRGRRLALFLDYDGTLTPIVRRPEQAVLSPEMRDLLRRLARHATVAVVSGRDLADVRRMVGLDEVYYAGSHGFDIAGPGGVRLQHEAARTYLAELDAAERALRAALRGIERAWVERKRFALAAHYREVADDDVARVEQAVDRAVAAHPRLRKRGGKRVFELQPDLPWDKGRAVHWLLDRLGLARGDVLPVYIGDDVTDEDAFEALAGRGIGIRVGAPDEPTAAGHVLRDPEQVKAFFEALSRRLGGPAGTDG